LTLKPHNLIELLTIIETSLQSVFPKKIYKIFKK